MPIWLAGARSLLLGSFCLLFLSAPCVVSRNCPCTASTASFARSHRPPFYARFSGGSTALQGLLLHGGANHSSLVFCGLVVYGVFARVRQVLPHFLLSALFSAHSLSPPLVSVLCVLTSPAARARAVGFFHLASRFGVAACVFLPSRLYC